jgi:hypothetical protein
MVSASVSARIEGGRVFEAWKVLGAIFTPASFNTAQIGSTPNSFLFASM